MSKKSKKSRKSSNNKKILICIILVILIVGVYFGYTKFFKKDKTVTAPKVVDEIKNFNYVVNEKDTKLFKTVFSDLKKVLSAKEIDNKKYAETIAKLFVIDFFNLENKTSKNDVGGVQFVYSSYQTDFVDYARDSIYKQINNSIDSKSKQILPSVTSVNIVSSEEVDPTSIFESYKSQDNNKGYEVVVEWNYKNGDGFQNKATLTIVTDGDKLSVAKMEE